MTRGTTPTVYIQVEGLDVSKLDTIFLTFKQNKKEITKKKYEEVNDVQVDIENNRLIVKFNQEETLYLNNGCVKVQLKGSIEDGEIIASDIVETTMAAILNEEVIE